MILCDDGAKTARWHGPIPNRSGCTALNRRTAMRSYIRTFYSRRR